MLLHLLVLKLKWQMFKLLPSDQIYHNAVHYGVDTQPSIKELSDLSEACSKLWELDLNRLVPGKDYEIDCGEGKRAHQKGDMAPESLFKWLGDDVLRRSTYARFCSLLDNYFPEESITEDVTPEEIQEQTEFIEEIFRTPPINYLHKYLVEKGLVSGNSEEFKEMLNHLWFDLYSRGGGYDSSSAFEHVFVGEIKGRKGNVVSGFHNWIQFYLEEAKGNVDYQGYIFPRKHGEHPDSETQLLTIQFKWNGALKSVSTTLVGVSPEFEVALYTLCFFVGKEDNHVRLGPYSVNIKCYHLGRDKIGSAFPIAEC
ncbi:poly(U)-specific endoribonuclease-B-like isoform X1 [Dendrobium catenatum]|uniref:Poly(U)-specific endoribonuclease n=1 Tax=Dendrobium catenatum TaxID=906689 RepID=A0A2I0WB08_9ASPA|nr:poly(U)-specific endoribonuclease-B-like isoform X1 [Dendrobium catenatum]PKU72848.1 poly(U)-specific endoribonuclease [Dendrobium catenatum]